MLNLKAGDTVKATTDGCGECCARFKIGENGTLEHAFGRLGVRSEEYNQFCAHLDRWAREYSEEEHKTDGTPCPCDPKRVRSFDVVVTNERITMSDGYHTFDELYEHRIILYIALCRLLRRQEEAVLALPGEFAFVWRSRLHSDGSNFDGWFVLGVSQEKGEQITYHIPIEKWEETNFAETLEKAPEFDGHTSDDVLERLKNI